MNLQPKHLLFALALASGVAAQAQPASIDQRHDRAVEQLRAARRADAPSEAQAMRRAALQVIDQLLALPLSEPQRRRAEFDRLVALSQLGEHARAVAYFEQLQIRHSALPAYVLSAAADSYAGLRKPDQALPLYEQALQRNPQDAAPHAGRIFALADLDRLDQAEDILEQRLRRHPDDRDDRLRLQLIRAWSGWVDQAAADVRELSAEAPQDAELARQQGGLELLRDRPYQALADYDRALTQAPGFVAAALARVTALDRLGRGREAAQVLQDLTAEASDWLPLERLRSERASQQAASLEASWRLAQGDDRQVAADETRREITLWSPSFAYHWRGFASWRHADAEFRGRALSDERIAAGLRWFRNGLRLQAEIDDPRDPWVQQHGFALSADWRPNDDWSLAASAAHAAFDLPLRARRAGVYGDRYNLAVRYMPRGQSWLRTSLTQIDYSDGNQRQEWYLAGFHRQPLSHRSALTLAPALAWGRNASNQVPYFSPLRDRSVELVAGLEQRIWARLSRRLEHRLEAFAGRYDQDAFGWQSIGGLRYQQRWQWDRGRAISARVGRDRRVYDGVPEYQSFVELGLQLAW